MSVVYFADVFHLPFVPEALVPSKPIFLAVVVLQLFLALLVTIGRAARGALLASALLGLYVLLCDRLAYHNNRYALFLFSFLLAFAPCDRAFVWGRPRDPSPGPLFAQRLAQLQLAIIYLASGGSKLVDSDWRGGLVIGDRMVRGTNLAIEKGVPADLMHLLAHPALAEALSKLAIATELGLAVFLFLPRARVIAFGWGVMFHLTIEMTSKVELFGWLTLTIYALFAVPKTRERTFFYDPATGTGRALAWLARRIDWLARFEIRERPGDLEGRAFAVVDRDGTIGTGLLGAAYLARATPVLFLLSLPLLAASRLRPAKNLPLPKPTE